MHLLPSSTFYSPMTMNMETRTERNKDWAGVLPDLLNLITQKFNDLPDLIRFRAVCKSWHSSVQISEPLPQQVPWILKQHNAYRCKHFRFFSPVSEKFYEVPVVPRCFLGQGPTLGLDGYLLMQHKDLSLMNPLTNHVIPLPKFDSLHLGPDICYRGEYYVSFYIEDSLQRRFQAIHHLGDDKWVKIPGVKFSSSHVHNKEMYFFNDYSTGDTTIFNIATNTVICVVPPPEMKTEERRVGGITLVESRGEILRVQKMNSPYSKTRYFNIYRLNFENETKNSYWVKIENIGNRVLFLSAYLATYGIMFEISRCPGLRRNSIYFQNILAIGTDSVFCRYDISNGELLNKDCGFKCWDVFVPSLQNLSCSTPSK